MITEWPYESPRVIKYLHYPLPLTRFNLLKVPENLRKYSGMVGSSSFMHSGMFGSSSKIFALRIWKSYASTLEKLGGLNLLAKTEFSELNTFFVSLGESLRWKIACDVDSASLIGCYLRPKTTSTCSCHVATINQIIHIIRGSNLEFCELLVRSKRS